MARFLITGDPGSGKSAVAAELARRGYAAHDTDGMPGVTRLEDAAGRPVAWPEPPLDWSGHAWNWQEAGLRELLAGDGTVLAAAITTNQHRFYSWFDLIFVLVAGPATLRRRLEGRQGHRYGGHPAELAEVLDGHDERIAGMLSAPHAVAIDAARPLGQVASHIAAIVAGLPGRGA